MKIREGFVSNSSSSSFMLVGFRAPIEKDDEYIGDIIEKFNESSDFKLDVVTDDDPMCFVGRMIFCVSDEDPYIEIQELDLSWIESFKSQLEEYEDKIVEMFGVEPDAKIFVGTVAS